MAVTIEGFTVVAQRTRIQHLLDAGSIVGPNSTTLQDEHIWKCSFMAEADARNFLRTLEKLGLNISQGPDSDAALISEFDRSVDPYCEWIRTGLWDKAVIAWKEGSRPESVTAREGWDPKVGSGLTFHDPSAMQHLEFLRLEDKVEVFLNKKTGKEVYLGRTSTPVDALFLSASRVVQKHLVAAGAPALTGSAAQEVAKAAKLLEKVVAEAPEWWNAQWFYAKSLLALGDHEAAYTALRSAYNLEKKVEVIPRELAGVCLELRRFDEAVAVAEEALALDPDNAELLGNLSLSYLLAGRVEHARRAIDAAIRIAPDDSINRTISRILSEIAEGVRQRPRSLGDLSQPAKPKRRWFRLPW
jgi:tetratricopeptide (TPR) repeat protein